MDIMSVTKVPPPSTEAVVLCIGKFDGVHLGHQEILRVAQQYTMDGGVLAVMSLWPHPLWVLAEREEFQHALTPSSQKWTWLSQCGVERVYDIEFTRDYATTSPETFVYEHLARLNLKRVVVGEGFNFGKGAASTTQELVDLCSDIGVPVTVVPTIKVNRKKISSTQIRKHVEAGRVAAAHALLGHPYELTGTVVHGDAVGRTLGFPTANLSGLDEFVMPAPGVYEALVRTHEAKSCQSDFWYALVSAGYRPTVNGNSYKVEAYLMDYSGDLYGSELTIGFLHRLRDEVRFPDLDSLVKQMQQDEEVARARFGLLQTKQETKQAETR
ncbi:riboflavin biosynthesis protein RibF [Alicyclobacillus sp. SO9]|nr:riboflavin biosynthesis protein RibF [Alicyclobacillus sp. SO9]